jgi:hypothetical protein
MSHSKIPSKPTPRPVRPRPAVVTTPPRIPGGH